MKIHRLVAPSPRWQPSAPQYKKYVALGDSYTSAPLVPLVELLSLGCLRSVSNYPKLLAGLLKVPQFTDVSCGGADTTHMTNPQGTVLGTFPPQFSALTLDTDLVTVGIGGNDFGVFGNIISTCPGLRASDPKGAPCQRHFTVNRVDTLKADIAKTQTRIADVVTGIKMKSPKATIVLVGYPKIAPEKGTCPTVLPFADGNYAYLYPIEQELNKAVETAAESTGATAAEQARWASQARDLTRQAAQSKLDQTQLDPAVIAHLNRLRTSAQR